MLGQQRGFTLIEIIIVVTVIGILSTMSVLGFTQYQTDSRDAQRASKATVIAEALEKYYDENGEYPGCKSVTQPAETVTQSILIGASVDSLQTPQGTGNSIRCEDLTELEGDYFAYVGGDTSPACTDGPACLVFTLQYEKESDGTIESIESRRTASITGAPTLTCSNATFDTVGCQWSTVEGANSYELARATDVGFATGLVIDPVVENEKTASDLDTCTQYHFRVRAVSASGPGSWSSSVPKKTLCPMYAPSCSATADSTTQITVSCDPVSGAEAYNYQIDDDLSFSFAPQYTTASTFWEFDSITPGKTWYFRVQAVGADDISSWSNTEATTPISAPSISATADSISQITLSWGAVPGAVSYRYQIDNDSDFSSYDQYSGTGTSRSFTGLNPGTTYYFKAQTVGTDTSSAWSGPANATTPNPVLSAAKACSDDYNIRPVYRIYLRLDETAYNIPANSSTVMWTAYRYSTNAAWHTWNQNAGHSHSIVVNGSSVKSGASKSYRFLNSYAVNSYEQLYGTSTAKTNTYDRGWITVAHNADGAKTISASVSDNFTGGQVPGIASCSISFSLSDLR